ncbi:MAG: ComEC/Rec2 family competence protein [Candidatus Paceibacteria bacterium]
MNANKRNIILVSIVILLGMSLGGKVFLSHKHLFTDQFRMVFLDVGQGDSVLIETPQNMTILIDGGRDQRALQQLIEVHGYFARTIDLLVLTHSDADHIGGIPEIMKHYTVRAVMLPGSKDTENKVYQNVLRHIKQRKIRTIPAQAGETISAGKVSFKVLHPQKSQWGTQVENENIHSIVLRGTYKDTSFLLPGDITAVEERRLVRSDVTLEADILKAAHHGSDSSTSQTFLDAVNPETVVISAGQDNRYGHPADEVLNRLKKNSIQIRSTIREGNVDIRQ